MTTRMSGIGFNLKREETRQIGK